MNKKKDHRHSDKKNQLPKKERVPWMGNPDDHEITRKVEPEEVNV